MDDFEEEVHLIMRRRALILLSTPPAFLELKDAPLVHNILVAFLKFGTEASQLAFILACDRETQLIMKCTDSLAISGDIMRRYTRSKLA